MVSLDLPSGLHTDTGAVLGTAIRASHTLCLGLWKRAFCQDAALDYLGQAHLIEFGIPAFALDAGLGHAPKPSGSAIGRRSPAFPCPALAPPINIEWGRCC